MKSPPAISIIMPAFCAAKTISQSIDTVRSQTLLNWELLIIDDGSLDETASIVSHYAKDDPRIQLVQRENSGPSVARNLGISLSSAAIIAFLDADDLWAPKRLEGMLEAFAEKRDAGVLFSRTRFIDARGETIGTLTPHYHNLTAADLMAENATCSTSNIVCRRGVIEMCGTFTVGLHYAEDQDWLLRIALSSHWQINGIDEEWFFYRSSGESLSSDLKKMRSGWRDLVTRAKLQFPIQAKKAERRSYGAFHRQLSRRAIRLGRPVDAAKYLGLALIHDPGLIVRQPRRTVSTLAGIFISLIPISKIQELATK